MGAALVPISPYLGAMLDLGNSYSKLIYVFCLPAVLFGLLALREWGGFARSLPVLWFAVLLAVGTFWTPASETTRAFSMTFAFGATIPLCALIRKHRMLFQIAVSFAAATACVLIYASTQPMIGSRWGALSLYGVPITNPAGMGIHAAAGMVLVLIAMPRSGGAKTLCAALAIALLVFCGLSASRTAAFALVAALICFPWARRRKGLAPSTVLVALLVLAVGVGVVGTDVVSTSHHSRFYEQLVSRTFYDEDGTLLDFGGRFDIWQAGYSAFAESWQIGYGTGAVDSTLGLYGLKVGDRGADGISRVYAHNTPMWLAVALGTTGLAAGGVLAFAIFRRAFGRARQWRAMALTAFLVILGVGAVTHQEPSWIITGAVLWALLSPEPKSLYNPPRLVSLEIGSPQR